MNQLILASAQTCPVEGDIQANLQDHVRFVKTAASQQADLILFPEMSLTGYGREFPDGLLFTQEDSRLDILREESAAHQMIIIAGAPMKIDAEVFIGSLIILPDGTLTYYVKQYLHPGEEILFQYSFVHDPAIKFKNEKIAFAICADIENPEHPGKAQKKGATLYAASIFYSVQGIPEAQDLLSHYAEKYSMMILMSNYFGPIWNLEAGGGSSAWDEDGKMIASLDNDQPGLLIIEKDLAGWRGKELRIQ